MDNDKFMIETIASGSYIDAATGADYAFVVEVFILRLNHVSLNEWLLSEVNNVRECYETDQEWEAHKAEYAAKREAVRAQIIEALGIDPDTGSVYITQVISEIFTLVYMKKV